MSSPQTMYSKIWNKHLVGSEKERMPLLYIDRHFIHEVTSPQAFEGLRLNKRKLRCPHLSFATMDHNISTTSRSLEDADEISRKQMKTLIANCKEFQVPLFAIDNPNNGIVHVIGPELGLTLPGMTVVCGDSHTSTHGAFGALAFGIGTSEVEHVMATQTLRQKKAKNMRIQVDGQLGYGVSAKDLILAIIGKIGTQGGAGHVIEYTGSVFENLSMEARMTVCNMSIEGGARAGLIAPDEKTYKYLQGRDYSPKTDEMEKAIKKWNSLLSDKEAFFDKEVYSKGEDIEPQVTWGTNPSQVASIRSRIPTYNEVSNASEKESLKNALKYMNLKEGTPIEDIKIDKVFIGSCTNSRIEDLRIAAKIVKGKKIASHIQAMVVPGSVRVRKQAEVEGLDRIFIEAGLEWRLPACSMCLAMNDDVLAPGERCASTSNRNFEGRQGKGGRTHLLSPAMAAASAIKGHFVDIREWQ